jgi:thioredoxin reductase (NADPH)
MTDCDVAVVGDGLAGLTAAAEVARRGLRCVAFGGATPGGLLLAIESVQGLPDHPDGVPGYDLGPMAQEAAMDAGVRFITDEATALQADGDGWIVRGAAEAVRARAVILAPGSRLRALGVPGEQRLAGKGVSHCASCDAPLLRGQPVAVVGGGDAACQEALTLAAHASAVHLLVRDSALRATVAWQQRVRAQPRITVHMNTMVTAIEGEQAVEQLRLAGGDALAVKAVFVYAGLVPNTAWLAGVLPLAAGGHIASDPARRLFTAGSARASNDGQAAGAIADGLAAAEAARQALTPSNV